MAATMVNYTTIKTRIKNACHQPRIAMRPSLAGTKSISVDSSIELTYPSTIERSCPENSL